MKNIISDELLSHPIELEATQEIASGEGRTLTVDANHAIFLTEQHSEQICNIALLSMQKFGPTQKTLATSVLNLPTALTRVDCTIDPKTGDIFAYEADERPAGMGITDMIDGITINQGIGQRIVNHLEDTFGAVPIVKRHPAEPENDDQMLLPVELIGTGRPIKANGRPILVRGLPRLINEIVDLKDAAANSVSTISDEGRRQYRISTGHAQLVTPTSQLPDESFVLKTMQGSQARGVKVFLTKPDIKQFGSVGVIGKGKVAQIRENEVVVLAEPFVPGIEAKLPDQRTGRLIMRVFCLLDNTDATVIGGSFVARPNHIVHGSSDAIAGSVVTQ